MKSQIEIDELMHLLSGEKLLGGAFQILLKDEKAIHHVLKKLKVGLGNWPLRSFPDSVNFQRLAQIVKLNNILTGERRNYYSAIQFLKQSF